VVTGLLHCVLCLQAVDFEFKFVDAFLSDCFSLTLAADYLSQLLYLIVICPIFGHNPFNLDSLLHDHVCLLDEVVGCLISFDVKFAVYVDCLVLQVLMLAVEGVPQF